MKKILLVAFLISTPVLFAQQPTNSILNIDTKGERIINVRVFNLSGQIISSNFNGNNTINVSRLESGIYLLKVETKNGTTLSRFIKK